VTGVVLAAGISRRLGTPKQLLPFGDTTLHGDRGVWRLIESGRFDVRQVPTDGTVPLDVDTWDDYQRLLGSVGR
jgi:CTP:molybdopterin cytidylyltransferase MocA